MGLKQLLFSTKCLISQHKWMAFTVNKLWGSFESVWQRIGGREERSKCKGKSEWRTDFCHALNFSWFIQHINFTEITVAIDFLVTIQVSRASYYLSITHSHIDSLCMIHNCHNNECYQCGISMKQRYTGLEFNRIER